MVFVLIPPGTFMMGSPDAELRLKGDDQAALDETPQHEVTITEPFCLGEYAVTQAEFARIGTKNEANWFSRTVAERRKSRG